MGYITLQRVKNRLPDLGADQDTILSELIDDASAIVDIITRRPDGFGQTTATRLFDATYRRLFVGDLVSVSTLRVKSSSSSAFVAATDGDYVLEPYTGSTEPYHWLGFSDYTTGSVTSFGAGGFRTVEITGIWGWPTVPKGIEQATAMLTIDLWRTRGMGSGQMGIETLNQPGAPSRLVSREIYDILSNYRKFVYA